MLDEEGVARVAVDVQPRAADARVEQACVGHGDVLVERPGADERGCADPVQALLVPAAGGVPPPLRVDLTLTRRLRERLTAASGLAEQAGDPRVPGVLRAGREQDRQEFVRRGET